MENTILSGASSGSALGSSPHTWRIQLSKHGEGGSTRIISTYVEITAFESLEPIFDKDHLHIRGDHAEASAAAPASLGSSPHTWRSPAGNLDERTSSGIISTYVEITW